MWSAAGWGPVPGANGAGYFQTTAADPAWAGSARRRRGREGVAASRAAAAAARARSRRLGLGLESPNSEAGARAGPEPEGGCVGRERRRRPPLAAGLFIPGKKFRSGRQGTRADCGGRDAARRAVATGTRRHHLSRRGAAAGTARRYPSRPGRCPSPAAVPAAAVVAAPPSSLGLTCTRTQRPPPHLGTLTSLAQDPRSRGVPPAPGSP